MSDIDLAKLFSEPKILGICGDSDSGKSNLAHDIIKKISQTNTFTLYTYGFRCNPEIRSTQIFTLAELEMITDSVIFIDEILNLFNLNDRKCKESIEKTLRLIHHNNCVVALIGLPENFKKFISAKLSAIFFKRSTLADFILGSRIKNIVYNFSGDIRGNSLLNLKDSEVLFWDGLHYFMYSVPYHVVFDRKMLNKPLLRPLERPSERPNVSEIVGGDLL